MHKQECGKRPSWISSQNSDPDDVFASFMKRHMPQFSQGFGAPKSLDDGVCRVSACWRVIFSHLVRVDDEYAANGFLWKDEATDEDWYSSRQTGGEIWDMVTSWPAVEAHIARLGAHQQLPAWWSSDPVHYLSICERVWCDWMQGTVGGLHPWPLDGENGWVGPEGEQKKKKAKRDNDRFVCMRKPHEIVVELFGMNSSEGFFLRGLSRPCTGPGITSWNPAMGGRRRRS